MIRYQTELKGLKELLSGMDDKSIQSGAKKGLKLVGVGVKDVVVRHLNSAYNINRATIDSKMDVKATNDSVTLMVVSRPMNLTCFGATQFGSRNGKRVTVKRVKDVIRTRVKGKSGSFGGVKVVIERSHTTLLPGAFIARVKAGSQGAFNIGVFREASHSARTQYVDSRNRRKTGRPYSLANRPKQPRKAIINMAVKTVSSLFEGAGTQAAIDSYLESDALNVVAQEIYVSIQGGA